MLCHHKLDDEDRLYIAKVAWLKSHYDSSDAMLIFMLERLFEKKLPKSLKDGWKALRYFERENFLIPIAELIQTKLTLDQIIELIIDTLINIGDSYIEEHLDETA